MAIVKNEIPILEYDSSPKAVIMPDHAHLGIRLPERAVFAFLGDEIDSYAQKYGGKQVSHFVSATKSYPIYVVEHHGVPVTLVQAPVGAAPAAQILDWLWGYGVKSVISTGTCGALVDLPENKFLLPVKALRDEGTSYHYLPPSRYVETDAELRDVIRHTLADNGLGAEDCTVWTTDGFYRETYEMVVYRREEGCAVVDMECAALAACAKFRGIRFAQMLFTADTLADVHAYDERDWGGDSFGIAMHLCVEAASRV